MKMFAAIRFINNKDKIIKGMNHYDCYIELFSESGISDVNQGFSEFANLLEDGFVDENEKWYTRGEAMELAKENSLLRSDIDSIIQSDMEFQGGLVAEVLKPEIRKIQK